MITDETLAHLRDASNRLRANEGGLDYQVNIACWLGERAHYMLDEIDRLSHGPTVIAELKQKEIASGLTVIAYAIRDAARKAHDSGLAKDEEEFDRLLGLLNLPADSLFKAALQEAGL